MLNVPLERALSGQHRPPPLCTGGEAANAAVCKTAIRGCKSHPVLAGVVQKQNTPFVKGRRRGGTDHRLFIAVSAQMASCRIVNPVMEVRILPPQ